MGCSPLREPLEVSDARSGGGHHLPVAARHAHRNATLDAGTNCRRV
jgi:hypothetical protein